MTALEGRLRELAARQHWVVGRRQLVRIGFSRAGIENLVARRRLYRLHRGVYAVGRPRVSERGRWMAAVIAVGRGAVLSHLHAAALWDLLQPRGLIDVTVASSGRRHRPGIRVHAVSELHPDDRFAIDAIPVTSLARTLLDLASLLSFDELQRAYERAERLEVLDLRAIRNLLDRSNGRPGVAALRSLAAYEATAAARAESELERLFADLVAGAGLPLPLTNVLVDGYVVDAFWPEANLVVELDGYEFHGHRAVFERDRERITQLRLNGRDVLPFTYRHVTGRPEWVLAAVAEVLARSCALQAPRL